MRLTETGASALLIALFFLFPSLFSPVSRPVIRLFGARVFSFAITMAFPVFWAFQRPVNRLYFFNGLSRAWTGPALLGASSGPRRGQKHSADRDIGDIREILASFCRSARMRK